MKPCPYCDRRYPPEGTYCFLCGGQLAEAVDSDIGRLLGARYRLDKRLWNDIRRAFRATDTRDGALCTVKILPDPWKERRREILQSKVEAAMRLRHPNVEAILSCEQADGVAWLVSKALGPQHLEELIARGDHPLARVIGVALQTARALAYCHGMNAMHGHLSPDLIFIRATEMMEDEVTVFGFDEPIFADPATNFFHPRLDEYVAPECVIPGPATRAGDLYALGAILYRLLTRREPPVSKDVSDALVRSRLIPSRDSDSETPPLSRSAFARDLPDGLETLVRSLLEPNPQMRPRDAGVVARELADIAAAAGVTPP